MQGRPLVPDDADLDYIANRLVARKENSLPTVLLLGSRAGGLFRSQALFATMQLFPGHLPAVAPLADRFTAAHQFLSNVGWGKEEMDGHLTGFLQDIAPTEADRHLVELIKLGLFPIIITASIDSVLEQALKNAGLRERFDFEILVPVQGQPFEINTDRQVLSRIIRPFGSHAARSYEIVKRNGYLDGHPDLKKHLERYLGRDTLAVGLDLAWDEELFRAFLPGSGNSLWFAHEEKLVDHPLVSRIFQGRPGLYIPGEEGAYEAFFSGIYQRIMQRSPRPAGRITVSSTGDSLLLPAPGAEHFVNRTSELRLIDEAFAKLNDQDFFLKTSVLVFHGISGIGKTTLLQQVMQRCDESNLPCIRVEAQDIPGLSRSILEQVSRYYDVLTLAESDSDWLDLSVMATTALSRKGPAVMLVDSLDPHNTEQVRWVESLLAHVLQNQIFVILSSKSRLTFTQERLVARRLKLLELKPLDRESCLHYLSRPNLQLEADVRDLIYEWTNGYPLALQVMKEALAEGFDLRKEQDRLAVQTRLIERVIKQKVLADVDPSRLEEYRTILPLLSVPRSFSIDIVYELMRHFAPDFQRESQMGYFTLPFEIRDVIIWHDASRGYTVDAAVRNLFLYDLKIRQPDQYRAIHAFLADFYYEQMKNAATRDRSHYLCEYCYHLVNASDDLQRGERIQHTIQELQAISSEAFFQFYEEFVHDSELQEALGIYVSATLSLIHRILAQMYRQQAGAVGGSERIHLLGESLFHVMQDQEIPDLPHILREELTQMSQNEAREIMQGLVDELMRNERFRTARDPEFPRFLEQLRQNGLSEG